MKNFNRWKSNIDSLAEKGATVPPLQLDPVKVRQHLVLRVLCSLDTKDVSDLRDLVLISIAICINNDI